MAKLLIIDDEKITRTILRQVVQYQGYEVDEALDGEQGLQMIQSNEYEIILLDIRMPKMSGIEVVEKIQELNIPAFIIMISAQSDTGTVVEAIKKGAFDFISKPIDMVRFMLTLENTMKYCKLTNETEMLKGKIKKANKMLSKEGYSTDKVKEVLST